MWRGRTEARREDGHAAHRVIRHRVLHAGHAKIKQLKAAREPYDADFDAAAQTIAKSATMRACSGDAAFAKAFDRLSGERS